MLFLYLILVIGLTALIDFVLALVLKFWVLGVVFPQFDLSDWFRICIAVTLVIGLGTSAGSAATKN